MLLSAVGWVGKWYCSEKGKTVEEKLFCTYWSLGWLQLNAATKTEGLVEIFQCCSMVPSLCKSSGETWGGCLSSEEKTGICSPPDLSWLCQRVGGLDTKDKVGSWDIKRASASSYLVLQRHVEVTCGKMPFTGALTSSLASGSKCGLGLVFLWLDANLPGQQSHTPDHVISWVKWNNVGGGRREKEDKNVNSFFGETTQILFVVTVI